MAKYTLKSKILTKEKTVYHKWGVKNSALPRSEKCDTFGGLYCIYNTCTGD